MCAHHGNDLLFESVKFCEHKNVIKNSINKTKRGNKPNNNKYTIQSTCLINRYIEEWSTHTQKTQHKSHFINERALYARLALFIYKSKQHFFLHLHLPEKRNRGGKLVLCASSNCSVSLCGNFYLWEFYLHVKATNTYLLTWHNDSI